MLGKCLERAYKARLQYSEGVFKVPGCQSLPVIIFHGLPPVDKRNFWLTCLDRPRDTKAGDSQVSEPCHDKPVNGVAQRAGGWRTGTPLFRSARNRNFLKLMSVGRAEIVSILKCILRLDHTYHYAPFNFDGICYIISSDYSQLFVFVLFYFVFVCLTVAYAALTPVQFLFSRYTRFISWFEK